MKTFLVTTHLVEGAAEKRAPFREAHLANLRRLHAEGHLLLGGALQNPLDAGVLVIRAATEDDARALLADDPYQTNGIWTKIAIREWSIVVGLPA